MCVFFVHKLFWAELCNVQHPRKQLTQHCGARGVEKSSKQREIVQLVETRGGSKSMKIYLQNSDTWNLRPLSADIRRHTSACEIFTESLRHSVRCSCLGSINNVKVKCFYCNIYRTLCSSRRAAECDSIVLRYARRSSAIVDSQFTANWSGLHWINS